MSVADDWNASKLTGESSPVPVTTHKRPLHRVAEVRRQQNLSLRSACRKLNLSADEVRRQEDPTCDLNLSQLCNWQQALEVPLAHLLIDLDAPLSGPVLTRARLLRIMKTVRAICEASHEPSVGRMATMLVEQLIEVMPELKEVSAWHSVGQRRTQDELGRTAERTISENFARDALQ